MNVKNALRSLHLNLLLIYVFMSAPFASHVLRKWKIFVLTVEESLLEDQEKILSLLGNSLVFIDGLR